MKNFKQYINEGANTFLTVVKPITVYKSTGPAGMFTKYKPLKLKKGDQIHNLAGGVFAVTGDNTSLGHIQITNPNDDNEGQHHARKTVKTGMDIAVLVKKNKIKQTDNDDVYNVRGSEYRG